jgi:hypothetical protein
MDDLGNYKSRRLRAYRAIDDLCAVVDHLGEETDPSILPLPETVMPPAPSQAVKSEMKNQLRAMLRLILAHNDAHLSVRELKTW